MKSKIFKLENFQNRNLPSTFFIELFHRHFSSENFVEIVHRNFSNPKFSKPIFFMIKYFFVQDFFYLKVWIVSFDSAGSRTPIIWWEYGLLEFYLSVLRIEWVEFVKYFMHCLMVYARARPKCGLPLRQRILWKSGILPPP